MKNIALIAVAGLAAGAAAQGVTLNFSASASEINVGDTVTFSVSASFTGFQDPSAYYGGFVGSFDANDNGLGSAGNFMNMMGGEGTPQAANGASVEALNIFNAALLGSNDPANPIDIFSFDVTAGAQGILEYTANGVNSVFPDDGIFSLAEEFAGTTVSDRVSIVPAPGAAALLGLGGLVAARRRR